jgi:CheY-like chemotaxis protein
MEACAMTSAQVSRPLRVVVVDDNLDTAYALAGLLDLGDHEVRLAHNGLDAVKIVGDFEPDLVFVDILLPGVNGYDLAVSLRKMGGHRPFLAALTGWAGEDKRIRSLAAGFDEHLTKPIDYATIARVLNAARTSTDWGAVEIQERAAT